MVGKKWACDNYIVIVLFTILVCGIVAFIAMEFAGIVTDIWYGFGEVMMEFGRVVEQLPV